MDDVGRSILWLSLAILFGLIAAVFSAANEAYDDAGVSRLRRLYEEEDDPKAGKLLHLQSKVQPYALLINLGCAFSLLLSAAFLLAGLMGFTTVWWHILIGMAIGSLLILLLCVALPRVLAESDPTGYVLRFCALLRFLSFVFSPMIKTVYWLAALCGRRKEELPEEDERTEEEIRLLVEAGSDAGAIEASEHEMIDNIFEFDDRTVSEVMTHRTDVFAVDESASLGEILDIALQEGLSRIPVYRGRIDKVIGVVYVKDLLRLLAEKDRKFLLEQFVRPVLYTPEQTMCNTLFREFNAKKVHFAIVVDEYGGTAGIVTMEDLLEAIVGNMQDEYDHEEDMIRKNDDGSYLFSGDLELDLAEKELDITFPEDDSADTLGGMLINLLQRIPEEGECPSVTIENWILQIVKIEDRHIEQVQATPILPDEEEEKDE